MIAMEQTGRTPDDAVAEALRKLGLPREYVLVLTLAEGAKGFLGFGGQEARVRLTVTPAGERLIQARVTLERLLALMGVQADVYAEERQGFLHLEVSGEHAGLLIGKYGQTIEAVQFLVGRILDRRIGERIQVQIDVEGYRERRRQRLEQMALRLAKQVKATGEAVVLEPMTPADRRIIHLVLQTDAEVRTASVGDGRERRLMIVPEASHRSP
ncbi:MAG: Jag N-terminal domain-containing protein [Candidatus Rokubacteria bacterium]|nr:Jag N-terminal domain-containing protein [Candidatus Rokubacteria bacterium]